MCLEYSKRDGTAAAKYPLQVSGKIARERAQRIRSLFDDQEQKFLEFQVGQTQKVLWESCREIKTGQWTLEGYSENYNRVRASASENRWNKIDPVTIEGIKSKYLLGKINNLGSKAELKKSTQVVANRSFLPNLSAEFCGWQWRWNWGFEGHDPEIGLPAKSWD